jgi:hypothetical protein
MLVRPPPATPNHRMNPTAQQLRCWVPASLRAAAAGYADRSASQTYLTLAAKTATFFLRYAKKQEVRYVPEAHTVT